MTASDYVIIAGTPRSAIDSTLPWQTHNTNGGGCQTADGGAKPDLSHNTADRYLVESRDKSAAILDYAIA